MDAITIKHAGAMPAPTWGWLKMNDTQIAIPAGMARGGDIVVEAAQELTSTSLSFEGAVAALQERVDAARGDAQDTRACIQAVQEQHAPGDDLGDLNIPALSSYQERACKEELANDVAAAFTTGMGIDTRSYLNFSAGETLTLGCAEGTEETATIRVCGEQGATVAASIDAIAEANAHLTLAISLDGEADAASAEPGLVGSELRVFAGENARVDVTVYTTCDAPFTAIDDSGYVLDRNARVTVRHVVLGGGVTATGMAVDLRSDDARVDIDTRYLAAGTETRDFNYVVRHRGKKTISNIIANGVLAGTSKKCLRGTIDLVHGCKGSEGTEREAVLIADKGVDNKTVPTILCDEDDVAGNHGATIGHVRPEQLFYLMSRGVSAEAAEKLFMVAKLEDAALTAPDDEMRARVIRLGNELIDSFEEDLA
ncbi:MAG TPA: SufD family Fe-S cluster assembly protein [Candidatus Limicola stercorigallinarum]|nr:SufD family Fe-S cluster assembly protein [Candidatus Limicola stercorigallinarum]